MGTPHLRDLPGTALPEGTYVVQPWADMLLRNILEGPAARGNEAHPLFGYIAAQCGIGIDVDGILALGRSSRDDGPMMASLDLTLNRPIRIGVEYRVTGQILSVERKHGRATGSFDLMRFEERLFEADEDAPAAHVINTWILPRRDEK
jgi:hypothetical protein